MFAKPTNQAQTKGITNNYNKYLSFENQYIEDLFSQNATEMFLFENF